MTYQTQDPARTTWVSLAVAMCIAAVRAVLLLATIALVLAFALAKPAYAATLPAANWSAPGADKYTGTTAEAIARLAHLFTPDQVAELAGAIANGQPTDHVTITRDAIAGTETWRPGISHMHFGADKVAVRVDRRGWHPARMEGGPAYCPLGSERCLLRPDVCGNWAVINRVLPLAEGASAGGPAGTAPQAGAYSAKQVPEPRSAALVAAALGALVLLRRRCAGGGHPS